VSTKVAFSASSCSVIWMVFSYVALVVSCPERETNLFYIDCPYKARAMVRLSIDAVNACDRICRCM
jgi:hypothetical protein